MSPHIKTVLICAATALAVAYVVKRAQTKDPQSFLAKNFA